MFTVTLGMIRIENYFRMIVNYYIQNDEIMLTSPKKVHATKMMNQQSMFRFESYSFVAKH